MRFVEGLMWRPEVTVPFCFALSVAVLAVAKANQVVEQARKALER